MKNEQGIPQWKKVKVKLEDHVNIPIFPSGLDTYDDHVTDYLSKISMHQLPQSRPLWDLHLIKYPTSKAAGTMVFKVHHALGDGFSLMGALFSCFQRADDPSLPLTFPSSKAKPEPVKNGSVMDVIGMVPSALSLCLNTVRDFGWSLLKSSIVEDDKSPVRSGAPGVEFQPVTVSSIDFSLCHIHKIKSKIGGTVNDVISGIVFYGTQLYIDATSRGTADREAQVTALVLLNTRAIGSYQPLNEMNKPDAKSPWGNQFGFIHVGIPTCKDPADAVPLQFIQKARQIIKGKKNSLGVFLTGRLLEMLRRVKGAEGTAKYIHATLRNTSMTISNLTGPKEQMIIAGHPVRSFYFVVVGVPQSLAVSAVSYMGKLTLALGSEQDFINPKLLTSCMEKSFERIFEAAIGMKPN